MNSIIVIDTNVFVSALISAEGYSRKLLKKCLQGDYQPLMGAALYLEYEQLLERNEIQTKCPLSKAECDRLLDAFMSVCRWTSVYYLWRPNLRDEADNHVVELAVAGNASAIITHNIRDFRQNELLFPSIKILNPRQLLEIGGITWPH